MMNTPRKYPHIENIDKSRTLFVKGNSMSPYLRTGDLLIFERVDPERLTVGDIITFFSPDKNTLVVHRLLKKKTCQDRLCILTKGDNNLNYDTSISQNDILGRANFLIRGGRTLNLNARGRKLLSRLLALFSVFNINLTHLKKNRLSEWCKRRRLLSFLLSPFLPKNINIKKFMANGKTSLRGFAGSICMAQATIDETDKSTILIGGLIMKFPFYNTKHGEIFLVSLIKHTKDLNKESLIFMNLRKENPLYRIFERMGLEKYINTHNPADLEVKVKELEESFFLRLRRIPRCLQRE